jgi:two-component system, NarL family, response regulator NreC
MISAKQLGVAIVVLSLHSDEGYVLRALEAGARGYLLKESPEAFYSCDPYGESGKSFLQPGGQPVTGGRLRSPVAGQGH